MVSVTAARPGRVQRATVRMERWWVLAMITVASTPFPPMSMSWPAPAAWPTSARRLPSLTGGPNGDAG